MAKDITFATVWFLRVAGLVVLGLGIFGITRSGFHSFRNATGIIAAGMLFLLSFNFEKTGKTKKLVAIGVLILALSLMLVSAAALIFPGPQP